MIVGHKKSTIEGKVTSNGAFFNTFSTPIF
jgi:hypothetical protein